MKKISAHDEREIKDYVKYNPHSLGSHKASKSKALSKAKVKGSGHWEAKNGETFVKSMHMPSGSRGGHYDRD